MSQLHECGNDAAANHDETYRFALRSQSAAAVASLPSRFKRVRALEPVLAPRRGCPETRRGTHMLSLAFSAAMLGIEGYVVRVEADSAAGSPYFAIIGLPDRALGEASERVRAAIFNSGFAYPAGRLLVNLSSCRRSQSRARLRSRRSRSR